MSIEKELEKIVDDSRRSQQAVELFRRALVNLTAYQIAKLPTKQLREAAILASRFLHYR